MERTVIKSHSRKLERAGSIWRVLIAGEEVIRGRLQVKLRGKGGASLGRFEEEWRLEETGLSERRLREWYGLGEE